MPSARKRALRDVDHDAGASNPATETPKETSLLQNIRNMWQFANLYQWIYIFGKVVKIDDSIDMDVLETECLKPNSPVLVEVGLALLKWVSSHRGLTPDLFDEYTRRQYVAKKPDHNPFGTDEEPARFHDFDVFTKIKVLQQLTQWVMLHSERIREKMDEQKPSDQTDWRIEPYGWDSDDRTYFLLDDDRLYRMTEAPPPSAEWKPKKNSKKAKAAARAAKRRRVSRSSTANIEDADGGSESEGEKPAEPGDDGLGGAKWECIAVTLKEVRAFLNNIRKTRDDNEKILRDRIEEGLVPILEKYEESRKRKALQREKELLNLEKLAHAKRSSRLANKQEQQKYEEQARQEEQRRFAEEAAARKAEQKRLKMENERDNRLMSRENRLREREARRLQHEELAQLSEDSKNLSVSGTGRLSERRLQVEIDKKKQALEELEEEEEDWFFDCVCGVHGQVDDGTHSIACEKCNVWMHSKCVDISEKEADRDDFHFVCSGCKRKQANPKPTIIKLKVKNPGDAPSSPPTVQSVDGTPRQPRSASRQSGFVVEIPSKAPDRSGSPEKTNGAVPQAQPQGFDGSQLRPTSLSLASNKSAIPKKQSKQTPVLPPPSPYMNGEGSNPFSSPHPTLSPPQQSPNKSRAYSTINHSSPSSGPSSNGEHRSLPPKGIFHISPKVTGAVQVQHQTPVSALPPHADVTVPPVAARSDSPLKQPLEAANNTLPVLSPPSVSFSTSGQPASSCTTPGFSTPQFEHSKPGPNANVATPALPPTQNGLSPLKRSPPAQRHSNNVHTPAPAILPPVAALSPTPSQQIMTPPVKLAEPIRPSSQQSSSGTGSS
ncbi:uncharacterized protein BCR38DRAFT_410722 [Pseudomassariella vexata]|uniref:Zinc finger PHD-type domain-containing protein n=1 Tax=Pseudomassariella vexata TaxID=1141098 RepID=A0A1Y2DSR2_9PEZI|nr:uncharacterized protein BCR38DRAFT_410722 [Pseudomassariella vexata]ORY62290.1 hypothetical protein BCR38DRAFT_410722 [Pseudomassariella vexata]